MCTFMMSWENGGGGENAGRGRGREIPEQGVVQGGKSVNARGGHMGEALEGWGGNSSALSRVTQVKVLRGGLK